MNVLPDDIAVMDSFEVGCITCYFLLKWVTEGDEFLSQLSTRTS
jgi:hypothetical protein